MVSLTTGPSDTANPPRILLIEQGARDASLLAALVGRLQSPELVMIRTDRLADGVQELADHGASAVLLCCGPPEAGLPHEQVAKLRAAAPHTPLLVLGELDEAGELAAIRAGAQDFLRAGELTAAALARALRFAVERQRAQGDLAHRALHDPLTGLPNRELFIDRLSVALDRARRSGAALAVLFVDLDNFKQVNDSLGHSAGDELLTVLAERLRALLRPMDTVARFGGDEFTLLFEDLDSEREAVLVAERISRALGGPVHLQDGETIVSASIGIALVSDPSLAPETVIREADAAMYRAKEGGRSRFELFDEASKLRAARRLELERQLRHALEHGELSVHYQPCFCLRTADAQLTGFEALVRWEHPSRGLLAPAEFVPLADEIGLAGRLCQYVVSCALAQLARWQQTRPELTVAVNLSARQLEDTALPMLVQSALDSAAISPRAFTIEIGEATLQRSSSGLGRTLEALRALGVNLAIDDYGTGGSSLARLRHLPFQTLKLDASLLRAPGGDGAGEELIGALVSLAHALDLRLVGEGIETAEQLHALTSRGADGAQGYLLGRPLPPAEASGLLD
jgi:diguanylate cyclase (GGDEF)-like protein